MMKKTRFIKPIIILVLCMLAVGSFAVFSEPGGTDDPVVTKSYIIEKVVPDIKAYVDDKVASSSGDGVTSMPTSFVIVNLKPGEKIVGEAGCELILRMGKATVMATQKGGLADTTAGYDLSDNTDMPSNHLLIIPVADGRGVKANSDAIVMVKGGYTVQ